MVVIKKRTGLTIWQLSAIFFIVALYSMPQLSAAAVEDEILVQWKGSSDITVITTEEVDTVLAALQTNPVVQHVERNVERNLFVTPNDTHFPLQYHLEQESNIDIDASSAWDTTTGDDTIIVAIIDTGVDIDHEDLAENIWVNTGEIAGNSLDDDGNGYIDDVNGWDFVYNDNDPEPYQVSAGTSYSSAVIHHGTHVAGTVGAVSNNGVGVVGVAWDVQIMPLRVFDQLGGSNTAAIIEAVEYAVANGADIINMSYGGSSSSTFELEALEAAEDAGIISVAAAGNDSSNLNKNPQYPICYDSVIGVGATDAIDDTSSFSNYGSDCIDLAAPGSSILSTTYTNINLSLNSAYGYLSGTSMSTPVVAGVAALARSIDSTATPQQIANSIINSTDPIADDRLGSGRVNADSALAATIAAQVPSETKIKSFKNDNRKTPIQRNKRTKDTSPFFSWSEPDSNNDIVGYYVYFGKKKADPTKKGQFITKRKYQATKVKGNEQVYRLRVVAVDDANGESEISSFKYLVDSKIQRPTSLQTVAITDGVLVEWQQPSGEHVSGYKVYRSATEEGGYEKLNGSLITEKQFLDTTVQTGNTYYYEVKSVDNLGNESTRSKHSTITL